VRAVTAVRGTTCLHRQHTPTGRRRLRAGLAIGALAVPLLAGCGFLGADPATRPVAQRQDVQDLADSASAAPTGTGAAAGTTSATPATATTSSPAPTSVEPTTTTARTSTTARPRTSTTRTTPRSTRTTKPPSRTTTSTRAGTSSTSVEAEVLRLVNVERSTNGCDPVSADTTLAGVARAHSRDMAEKGYFDHDSPDGRDPFQRMRDAGYRYSWAAENIAAGQSTAASVMSSWMKSAGHRANILNCKLTELGVGLWKDADSQYRIYWTQDFGTPR
jgi:uncharacterized protein YkwD